MIINSNNKDNILKGTIKRGFNKSPDELREEIFNKTHNIKDYKNSKENDNNHINDDEDNKAFKLSETISKLKRLK